MVNIIESVMVVAILGTLSWKLLVAMLELAGDCERKDRNPYVD